MRCRDGTEDNNYNFDKEADPDVFQTLRPQIWAAKIFAVCDICGDSFHVVKLQGIRIFLTLWNQLYHRTRCKSPPTSPTRCILSDTMWFTMSPTNRRFVGQHQVWCTNNNRHSFLHLDHHSCSLERFTKSSVICCLCCKKHRCVWSFPKFHEICHGRSRSLLHYPGLVKPQRPNFSAETHRQKWRNDWNILELCSPDDTDSCSNHSHAGCSILWAAYLGGVAQWNLEVTFSDFLERDLSRFWSHPLAWRQDFWEICIPSIHEFSDQERLNAPYTEWVMISAKTSEQRATVDGHNPAPFGKYR